MHEILNEHRLVRGKKYNEIAIVCWIPSNDYIHGDTCMQFGIILYTFMFPREDPG
jgi:hypothetical protein